MRFVKVIRIEKEVWGQLEGDRVFVMDGTAYDAWTFDGRKLAAKRSNFLPPCDASKVVCVESSDAEKYSVKRGEQLKGHLSEITLPEHVEDLRYEGKIALVIKKRAEKVKAAEAFNYILGVTCMAEVFGAGMEQEVLPMGPIVSDEVDPFHLTIRTKRNGELAGEYNTEANMAGICEMLEAVTAAVTLETGDVLAVGTDAVLSGLQSGDEIELEIEGVGTLKNTLA